VTVPYIGVIGPLLVAWLIVGAIVWGRRYG
jgi:hypothetical protein